MLKDLFVVAVACCLSTPASAGDRPKAKPKPTLVPVTAALLLHDDRVIAGNPGARTPVRAARSTFILPPAPGGLERAVEPARLMRIAARAPHAQLVAANGASEWVLEPRRVELTGSAGGSYAVRDYFAAQPKPRQRRSPMGAMFVLRLDGAEESPSFSEGGGGVPAALWGVVPKR